MDKIAKDFLINDELARHMASMSEAIDTIDPREKNKVTYRANCKCLSLYRVFFVIVRVGMI